MGIGSTLYKGAQIGPKNQGYPFTSQPPQSGKIMNMSMQNNQNRNSTGGQQKQLDSVRGGPVRATMTAINAKDKKI